MILDKCECYHTEYGKTECWGTKECERCNCEGDTSQCDFYPEKRKENKTMNTAEMWLKAQENNKLYCSGDMAYSTQYGFVNLNDFCDVWEPNNFSSISEIMTLSWEEVMTIPEAEKMFGVRIIKD